ncbi:MAG TPA: methyltransferase domain-containing protein, partial [Sphingomicrobium sp.]|nr:methyltransferase domain-containing protein [Sphingomicrobium sp.]
MAMKTHQSFAARAFKFPRLFDALLRFVWGSAEGRYREKLLDIANVCEGESVLDVGCGTGTLAIAACRRVGSSGFVAGVDSSP